MSDPRIAVVIPVHNEAALLARCLDSMESAAAHPLLSRYGTRIIVVLDRCTDRSADIARRYDVTVIEASYQNVGKARARGAATAIAHGAEWLACTDADSVVPPDWLAYQYWLKGSGVDAMCGTIDVDDWSERPSHCRLAHEAAYRRCDGHRHIHGANLGVRVAAYTEAGGFEPLATGEDVALVGSLQANNATLVWPGAPSVRTSARRVARAERGFSTFLNRLESDIRTA